MRIYFRGNLYGCNQATAFVEDKGKIIFIGSDKEALKYSGEQIDLNNKYVYSLVLRHLKVKKRLKIKDFLI